MLGLVDNSGHWHSLRGVFTFAMAVLLLSLLLVAWWRERNQGWVEVEGPHHFPQFDREP